MLTGSCSETGSASMQAWIADIYRDATIILALMGRRPRMPQTSAA
jgi:hypothetical protein